MNQVQKLVRYFMTAGTAAIIDVGGFALLFAAGISLIPSAILSFVIAAVVNYLLTSRFVFGATASAAFFSLFFLGALAGLTINVGVTFVAATYLDVPATLAKIAGVGISFFANFVINTTLVFRRKNTLLDE